jgi:SAM-dependent methyltransferase
MNWIERYHSNRIHTRRVRVLATTAAQLLPPRATVLDVGCGDGRLAAFLGQLRPDLSIVGAEVSPRADCQIQVTGFDGRRLPFADGSFDATLIVDVLHHTTDPAVLLREAARVARKAIVVKDHFREGLGAAATLRFMDTVGNRRHGVALPFNYLNAQEWNALFIRCGVVAEASNSVPGLYPFPANLVFGRGLHFFARLGFRRNETLPLASETR